LNFISSLIFILFYTGGLAFSETDEQATEST